MLGTLQATQVASAATIHNIALRCPRCGGMMESNVHTEPAFLCSNCHFSITLRDGIWLSLPAERTNYFSRFIADYEMIRAAEGRGSQAKEYYRELPYVDRTGNNKAQWKIRAHTFTFLKNKLLPFLKNPSDTVRILDIGAGNGWLSYRLAQLGFEPVAVDLLVNNQDGLGAMKNYDTDLQKPLLRFQAESTKLPFRDEQFDAVIFNASFHYAESYEEYTREALRCLKHGGLLVIADSPWYSRQSSGERMLAERRTQFFHRFGTYSDSIPSLEFLTDERLETLEWIFGIKWKCYTPFYGVRWALRPLIAKLQNKREPARFRIFTARRVA